MNNYVVIILLPLFTSIMYFFWKKLSEQFQGTFLFLSKINDDGWGLISVMFFCVLGALIMFTNIMDNKVTGTVLVFIVSSCTSLKNVAKEKRDTIRVQQDLPSNTQKYGEE